MNNKLLCIIVFISFISLSPFLVAGILHTLIPQTTIIQNYKLISSIYLFEENYYAIGEFKASGISLLKISGLDRSIENKLFLKNKPISGYFFSKNSVVVFFKEGSILKIQLDPLKISNTVKFDNSIEQLFLPEFSGFPFAGVKTNKKFIKFLDIDKLSQIGEHLIQNNETPLTVYKDRFYYIKDQNTLYSKGIKTKKTRALFKNNNFDISLSHNGFAGIYNILTRKFTIISLESGLPINSLNIPIEFNNKIDFIVINKNIVIFDNLNSCYLYSFDKNNFLKKFYIHHNAIIGKKAINTNLLYFNTESGGLFCLNTSEMTLNLISLPPGEISDLQVSEKTILVLSENKLIHKYDLIQYDPMPIKLSYSDESGLFPNYAQHYSSQELSVIDHWKFGTEKWFLIKYSEMDGMPVLSTSEGLLPYPLNKGNIIWARRISKDSLLCCNEKYSKNQLQWNFYTFNTSTKEWQNLDFSSNSPCSPLYSSFENGIAYIKKDNIKQEVLLFSTKENKVTSIKTFNPPELLNKFFNSKINGPLCVISSPKSPQSNTLLSLDSNKALLNLNDNFIGYDKETDGFFIYEYSTKRILKIYINDKKTQDIATLPFTPLQLFNTKNKDEFLITGVNRQTSETFLYRYNSITKKSTKLYKLTSYSEVYEDEEGIHCTIKIEKALLRSFLKP